ncbi:MAG: hypothetical protein QG608_3316 [Actinomycetota bacterium]|nr:hypothetical protein [Actinomycetota bacterium]
MDPFPIPTAPGAAVVFDCDGLLVTTQGAWDRAYAALAARYGHVLSRSDRRAMVGLQLAPLGEHLSELLKQPGRALGCELYDLVQTNLGQGFTPMPGAVELVDALVGSRPLAVASNTPSSIVCSYLKDAFDLNAFDAIVGSDCAAPKPAPDIYLRSCELIGVSPSEAVALEDSVVGANAARSAGLYLIGVPSQADMQFPCDLHATALHDPRLWNALGILKPNTRRSA